MISYREEDPQSEYGATENLISFDNKAVELCPKSYLKTFFLHYEIKSREK